MTPDDIEIMPIAIGEFADAHLCPLEADEQVHELGATLAEFGGVLRDWDTPMPNRGGSAIDTRLAAWSSSEHPYSVLYWVGHASNTRGHPRLQHASSNERANFPGVTADRIAETIAARHGEPGGHWLIVIIDTCWSAAFVCGVNAVLDALPGPRQVLLVGTSGDGSTTLGRFTTKLRAVLRHNFGGTATITLWDLAGELRRALPEAEIVPKQIMHGALHRNTAVTGAVLDVIDDIRAVIEDLPNDERRHFIPKAQGGELSEITWYFEGRHTELASITEWLADHDSGLLAVTGPAGSGKSALLGYLITQTLPHLRTVLAENGLIDTVAEDQRPPDYTFNVVIHLTGLSIPDIITRVAAALGLGEPPAVGGIGVQLDWLTSHIRTSTTITVLADALDEAVDPLTVAGALLRPLAALPGVRVVVGTRRDTRDGPDLPAIQHSNLLDALKVSDIITVAADPQAIGRYIINRLDRAARSGRIVGDARAAYDLATRVASSEKHFLFARLAVHEILATATWPVSTELSELLAADHRGLFRRALNRISAKHPANLPIIRALAHSQGRGIPLRDGVLALVATALAPDHRDVSDDDIHTLLDAAAPYILLDNERDQAVYRLAHRTFAEHFTNNFTDTQSAHSNIAAAFINSLDEHPHKIPNTYVTHHLSAHIAHLGEIGWTHLAQYPHILDRLDPTSVTADAMRTAFGHHPLPPAVAGIIGASHHLATALQHNRPGIRQLSMARHTHPAHTADNSYAHWQVLWALLSHVPTHHILAGRPGWVWSVAAVPMSDGRTLLATGSQDGALCLWDPVSGVQVGDPMTGHAGGVLSVVAVPMQDGRALIATGGLDGTVRLWDPIIGAQVGRPFTGHTSRVWAVVAVVTPNQRIQLASASSDRTVRLWDLLSGDQVGEAMTGHTGKVLSVTTVATPNGPTLLASGSSDRTVRLWDPTTGVQVGEPMTGHTGGVLSVAAVPMVDGRTLLATASHDGTVRLWDPVTGNDAGGSLNGHTNWVSSVVSVPMVDGRTLLATASHDGTVRLWDPVTASTASVPLTYFDGVSSVAAMSMPDGRTLLATVSSDGQVILWDPFGGKRAGRPMTFFGKVSAVESVSMPNGRNLLVVTTFDGTVILWDPLIDKKVGRPMTGHTNRVSAVAAVPLPDGRTLLATANDDGTVILWDPLTGRRVAGPWTGHTNFKHSMAAVPLPDGRTLLATASDDGAARLWDPITCSQIGDRLAGHTGYRGRVRSVATVPRPDGPTLLATGSRDGTVRLWDPATGHKVGDPLTGHTGEVLSVAAVSTPNGRTLLATASDDRSVRLWQTDGNPHNMVIELGATPSVVCNAGKGMIVVAFPDGVALLSIFAHEMA
jgi:WD40 repeat protein